MKKLLYIFLLLLPLTALAGNITIEDFSFGLNTKVDRTKLVLGEATMAYNVDLTKSPTDASVRDGFEFLFTVGGADSILTNGLFSMVVTDGFQRLLIATDSTGAGFGNIYQSENTLNMYGSYDSTFFDPNVGEVNSLHTVLNTDNSVQYYMRLVDIGNLPTVIYYADLWVDLDTITDAQVVDYFVELINVTDADDSLRFTAIDMVDSLVLVEKDSTVVSSHSFIVIDTFGCSGAIQCDSTWRDVITKRVVSYTQPDFGASLTSRYPALGRQWWLQHNNAVMFGTGVSSSYIFDGNHTNSFPLEASAEIHSIPLSEDGGGKGTYRYTIEYVVTNTPLDDTVFSSYPAVIGAKVVADSNKVLLFDFPPLPKISPYDTMTYVQIEIYRSLGDVGGLDESDYLYRIDSFEVDTASLENYTYTDTNTDSTLHTKDSILALPVRTNNHMTADNLGVSSFEKSYNTGSPLVIKNDTANGTAGIWEGLDNTDTLVWEDVAGWAYMVVAIDTTMNVPSDSSRSYVFYQPQKSGSYTSSHTPDLSNAHTGFSRDSTEKITLVMPPSYNDNIIYQLFRGSVEATKFDSIKYYGLTGGGTPAIGLIGDEIYSRYSKEFFVYDYFLVGEFGQGDTCFDSLSYNELIGNVPYVPNAIPDIITDGVSHNNNLVFTDGDYIYYSNPTLDSITFGVLSKFPIDGGDGQKITALEKYKKSLRAFKGRKAYNLYKNSQGGYSDVELSGYYGNVAPFGTAVAPEGVYFMSTDGARLEKEGIYLDRTFRDDRISNTIDKFDNMDYDKIRNVFSFYYDNKWIISIPDDTTYVYNKTAIRSKYRYGWTQWGLSFNSATLFGSGLSTEISSVDTLVFSPPSSPDVFLFGESRTDDGEHIEMYWWSGSLIPPTEKMYSPTNIFYQIETDDSSGGAGMQFLFYDQKHNHAFNSPVERADTSEFYVGELPLSYASNSWYLLFAKNGFQTQLEYDLKLKKININFEEAGRIQR